MGLDSQFLYLAKDLTIQSDVINVLMQQVKYSSVTHFLKKKKNRESVAKCKFLSSSSNSSEMSL